MLKPSYEILTLILEEIINNNPECYRIYKKLDEGNKIG